MSPMLLKQSNIKGIPRIAQNIVDILPGNVFGAMCPYPRGV